MTDGGSKPTVLLVDDEVSILESLQQLLEYFGVQALTAETGEAALAIVEDSTVTIDAVILDLRLPGMGGRATGEALRRQAPDCPIIISSGMAIQDLDDELEALGSVHLLPKPYTADDIAGILRQAGVAVVYPSSR